MHVESERTDEEWNRDFPWAKREKLSEYEALTSPLRIPLVDLAEVLALLELEHPLTPGKAQPMLPAQYLLLEAGRNLRDSIALFAVASPKAVRALYDCPPESLPTFGFDELKTTLGDIEKQCRDYLPQLAGQGWMDSGLADLLSLRVADAHKALQRVQAGRGGR